MNFTNKTYGIIVNSEIVEYDIRSANTSVAAEYELFPANIIDRLMKMHNKHDRHVAFGLLLKKNPNIAKRLEKLFNEVVKRFIAVNKLEEDDILSVKKDAVFVINHKITNPILSQNIEFVAKNSYDAFLHISPYEFFFQKSSSDFNIEVKGLTSDTEERNRILKLHENGVIAFLKDVIDIYSKGNHTLINEYMSDFVNMYKKLKLDCVFYREFNQRSKFKISSAVGGEAYFDSINSLTNVNILHNYMNIILPTLSTVCL